MEVISKQVVSELEVHEALAVIVANSHLPALNYAVNYAALGEGMTGKDLKVQCLYVLNNITGWRGDKAKQVRDVLKRFSKQKESN